MLTKFSRIVGVTYMYVIICAVCKTMGTYADTVRSCTNLHTCMPVCIHCFSLHPCDVDDFCVKFTERLNIYIYWIYICICIYMYVCIYSHKNLRTHWCWYGRVYMYTFKVCVYTWLIIWIFQVCLYVCMDSCMCVCVCLDVCLSDVLCMYVMYVCMYGMYLCMYILMYVYMYGLYACMLQVWLVHKVINFCRLLSLATCTFS